MCYMNLINQIPTVTVYTVGYNTKSEPFSLGTHFYDEL